MATLKERLEQDMKEALRAREAGRLRLSVVRMVRAAIKNAEIDQGGPIDDAGVLRVIQRELKQRRESLAEFEKAGRAERAAELREEIAILEGYQPAQLSDEELEELLRAVIAEVGAQSPADLGRVMAAAMRRAQGRAEGSRVQAMARRLLGPS